MSRRLEKLRHKLAESELDGIFISQPESRRYLSGFTGSAGFLLISQESAILATDFRYLEQAQGEAPDFQVVSLKNEPAEWFPQLASEIRAKRLGFEAGHLSFAVYRQLTETVNKMSQNQLQFLPAEGLVEELRAVKEEAELELIAEAVKLADAAFEHVLAIIRPGMREREVAWELEKFLREAGSEPVTFQPIVASGPNSALPHATASERPLAVGEPVVIDIGARVGGYSSDLSRTLCLGQADRTFTRIYDVVLGAQLTALATIEAGLSGDQADQLARTVIEQAGYGDAFGHGLGHGVGLAVHEEPRLGPNSAGLLAEGMVFTIEPAIYLKGWGGVRLEDVVVMEDGRARVLSKATKVGQLGGEG
ncbi:MAG: aminopeptidase P family protein [Dehalococcoidia bacterium]